MSLTLVTGAPGWLGTRLAHVLVEGLPDVPALLEPDHTRRIRCLVKAGLDTSSLRKISNSVEIVEGDLRDAHAAKTFCENAAGATLFHCAGVVHPARYVREFFDLNVQGTRYLLQAAENAQVRRIVVVSSNSPFGFNDHREHLFNEESPYNPYMAYGRSKMMMEQVVREHQARGKLQTVVVRPPWFYGPGQPPRQTEFFRMIKRGVFPIVGDGESRRSMAYIDNVCQALLLCERVPTANGQVYWVADRRPYTMNEIVATVEELMETGLGFKVAHKQMRLPSWVSDVVQVSDALIQRMGFYHQKIHVLSEMGKTIACSIAKAERELGYEPTVELEEGMRRSIAWCLAEGITI